MTKKFLAVVAVLAAVGPMSAFAYDGTLTFKGGCKVANTGSCNLAVSGIDGSVKIYAASAPDGNYGPVTNAFTSPSTKRVANSKNNVCFYAKSVDSASRTRKICLAN